jgi:hypothetical protein
MDSLEKLRAMVARLNAGGYLPPPLPGIAGKETRMKEVKLAKGKEFDFSSTSAQATKYPWDAWFSGKLLMIERSEGPENEKGTIEAPTLEKDFGVRVDAMVPKIHTAARRKYKVVQISRKDHDGKKLKDALIIKARDMMFDERQEEDLLRQQEKEDAKTRLAVMRAVKTANPGVSEEDQKKLVKAVYEGTDQQVAAKIGALLGSANGSPAPAPATAPVASA